MKRKDPAKVSIEDLVQMAVDQGLADPPDGRPSGERTPRTAGESRGLEEFIIGHGYDFVEYARARASMIRERLR